MRRSSMDITVHASKRSRKPIKVHGAVPRPGMKPNLLSLSSFNVLVLLRKHVQHLHTWVCTQWDSSFPWIVPPFKTDLVKMSDGSTLDFLVQKMTA